jgi:hypothetical protein
VISKAPRPFALFSVVVWFVLSVGLGACQTTTPAPHAVAPVTQKRAKPPESKRNDALAGGTAFKTFSSARFNLSLALPDNQAFKIEDQKTSWFVAEHTPTGSSVLVRSWREYELMNRVSCEERARLHKDLPGRERGTVIDDRRIDIPSQHDTMVEVRLREQTESPRYVGTVLAFGGWARHCFAFVFATTNDDKKIVIARLSTIVHGTLEHMKFDDPLVPQRAPPDLETPLHLDPRGPIGP